ncbi:MAG: peroxidase, partial [Chloroflexi bacterium]|nr:peroxidase [Chloroflexota bacterium]
MGGASVTATIPSEVDYADVQGLVRFGYSRMENARYDLLHVKDATAARAWLRSISVTTALKIHPQPKTALHVAFTAPGLDAIGVAPSIIEQFSHEFRTGMATEYRGRQLGDVGGNAAGKWKWGHAGGEPHLLVMLFGADEHFDGLVQASMSDQWEKAFEVQTLDVARLTADEPFGFADGISQPEIDWEQERETPTTQVEYTNLTSLGEFLLGYPNEYGKITDRPLLDPMAVTEGLLAAHDAPKMKALGRNGTYIVMRQLHEHVWTFWQFNIQQAGGDAAEAEKLASAMIGRAPDGIPLVPLQKEAIPGVRSKMNQFTFDSDPAGVLCPFGAHIRRANPRNIDLPERPASLLKKLIISLGFGSQNFRYDLMSSVRFHRILRRGRGYGPPLPREDAFAPRSEDENERGLHFICLNANISRQFEFVQNAWIANTKFSGMTGESDPLLGNREPIPGCKVTSDFNLPQEGGLRQRVSGLPRFVTMRGGAYFFLPSLRALRYFA